MRARQQPGPVVAGASGLAGSWRIPFVRQIRSDSASAAHDLPNQPAPLALPARGSPAPRRHRRIGTGAAGRRDGAFLV